MNQPRTIIWAKHVVCREDMINVYMVLVKKFERRRVFERKNITIEDVKRIRLAQNGELWLALVKRKIDFQST